jgi:putative ABC transport system substrate-binding protein
MINLMTLHRRRFLTLAVATVVSPNVALPQSRSRTVAFFFSGGVSTEDQSRAEQYFLEGLAAQGWVVGPDVAVVVISTANDPASIRSGIDELRALSPDVIYSHTAPRTHELVNAITETPIVFSNSADPISNGLVDNLARPGGNATGFYFEGGTAWDQSIELLKEVVPRMERVGFFYSIPTTNPVYIPDFEMAARAQELEPFLLGVTDVDDYRAVISEFANRHASGLVVDANIQLYVNRASVIDAVDSAGIPAIYYWSVFARDGGLMAWAPDEFEPFRQAGHYVGRILSGQRVSELPVQQSTRFKLILNMRTAASQGVTFPTSLLASADEVIE